MLRTFYVLVIVRAIITVIDFVSPFFNRNKKYDMFAFLASSHRVAPQLEESAEEQESAEQARDGPLSVKYVRTLRTLKMPLSWGFKLNHLILCFVTKIRGTEFGLLYIPAQTDESIAR